MEMVRIHTRMCFKKCFVIYTYYSVENVLPTSGQQHGGHNKDKIMTVKKMKNTVVL